MAAGAGASGSVVALGSSRVVTGSASSAAARIQQRNRSVGAVPVMCAQPRSGCLSSPRFSVGEADIRSLHGNKHRTVGGGVLDEIITLLRIFILALGM